MTKSGIAFAAAFFLSLGACWAQSASNSALQGVMPDIDASAPGVKPDPAISVKLGKAMSTLDTQMNSGALSPDDLALAHLYHAKAWYFLFVNNHNFEAADYDREDARAIRYEFELAIEMMTDRAAKTGKDWKKELSEANWQAGNMVITIAVDQFTAYDEFFPNCAALGNADCKKMMAQAPK